MKKHKISLMRRCLVFCALAFVIAVAATIGSFFPLSENVWSLHNTFSAIFFALTLGLLLFYGIYGILLPYRRLSKTVRRFISGETFDELFRQKILWSWEMEEVLLKIQELLKKQETMEHSRKEAEFQMLQNQINPHFLYNTLEAIRGDALSEGMDSIALATEALATFFRYTISKSEHLVALEDELDNVKNYFYIQQYRFGEQLHLEIQLEDERARSCLLPKLILQPLVENAIYHGLECKAKKGTVQILVELTQSRLLIHVMDDGVGMPEKKLQQLNTRLAKSVFEELPPGRGGIALPNVNNRIRLLFGEDYGIRIHSTPQMGTDVEVTIPLLRAEDHQKEAKVE